MWLMGSPRWTRAGWRCAAARRQQQCVEAQLKAGAADQLDVLNARLELGLAILAQFDGQAKLQQALGAMEDALQRPIDSATGTSPTLSLINTAQRAPERSN